VFELDHVFVFTDVGAPEAGALVACGLAEGRPNAHPGQGTANRRFFFENAMLELLWVCDAAEAQSASMQRSQLWSRWSQRHAGAVSPFGVCLRATRPGSRELPFSAWEYRPAWLPAPHAVHVGADVPLSEPWWFYLGFARKPDAAQLRRVQPREHPAGFQEITHLRVSSPVAGTPSAVAREVVRTGFVALACAREHSLQITLDGGTRGCLKDLRPVLPLLLRW
jgi:hypothetical protein